MLTRLRQLILFFDEDPFALYMSLLILGLCMYLVVAGAGWILLQMVCVIVGFFAGLWVFRRLWTKLVRWAKQGEG